MKLYPFNAICPCHGEIVEKNGGFDYEWVTEIKLPFNPIEEGHIVVALRSDREGTYIICSLGE